jgi:hypothetical protein
MVALFLRTGPSGQRGGVGPRGAVQGQMCTRFAAMIKAFSAIKTNDDHIRQRFVFYQDIKLDLHIFNIGYLFFLQRVAATCCWFIPCYAGEVWTVLLSTLLLLLSLFSFIL